MTPAATQAIMPVSSAVARNRKCRLEHFSDLMIMICLQLFVAKKEV